MNIIKKARDILKHLKNVKRAKLRKRLNASGNATAYNAPKFQMSPPKTDSHKLVGYKIIKNKNGRKHPKKQYKRLFAIPALSNTNFNRG